MCRRITKYKHIKVGDCIRTPDTRMSKCILIRNRILTVWACDDGAALVSSLLYCAVLTDGFGEGADPEVAHEHSVVASAVQTGFVRHDTVPLGIVPEVIVAAFCVTWNV